MMEKLFFDNPILVKHWRARTRKNQLNSTMIVVLVITASVMWAGYEWGGLENGFVFGTLFVFMGVALQFAGTTQVAVSMGQTNDSGVLDFHRISPLPPHVATVGFILGAPIREYLCVALIAPFALLCAILGVPGILGFLQCMIVLFTTSLLFHALAVSSGLLTPKGKTRGASVGQIVILLVASLSSSSAFHGVPIPGLLTVGPTFLDVMFDLRRGEFHPTFFGVKLPIFLQTILYQLPLLGFVLVAAVRKMRSQQAPLFSKPIASAFMVTVCVLNLGGVIGHPRLNGNIVIPLLLYTSVFFAIWLIVSISPQQNAYRNGIRRAHKLEMPKAETWADHSSNRAVLLVIGGIAWANVQSALSFLPNVNFNEHFLLMTTTAVATILHFGSAHQYFKLKFRRRGNGSTFLFCFLFWLVPLVIYPLVLKSFGPVAAQYIGAVSPIFGIAQGSLTGLISAGGLAVAFGILCYREEQKIQGEVNQEMQMSVFVDE